MTKAFLFISLVLLLISRSISKQTSDSNVHTTTPSLPSLSVLTILTKPNYSHLKLLLESMRWNSKVDFTLLNVLSSFDINSSPDNPVKDLAKLMNIENVRVEVISYENLSERIKKHLGISVNINKDWISKLRDFKPALAHLFPEFVSEDKKYWGYGDENMIWGNISAFSYLFDEKVPYVSTNSWKSQGPITFFLNKEASRSPFLADKDFVQLLLNDVYYNLDETGIGEKSKHSIASILQALPNIAHPAKGKNEYDKLYVNDDDSHSWAGPIRWFRGTLAATQASDTIKFEQEFMYYHNPTTRLDYSDDMRSLIFDDMILYGYLLPTWIPLLSRFQCRKAGADGIHSTMRALEKYHPYHKECMDKWTNVKHFIE